MATGPEGAAAERGWDRVWAGVARPGRKPPASRAAARPEQIGRWGLVGSNQRSRTSNHRIELTGLDEWHAWKRERGIA